MRTPFHEFCLKSGVLCLECQQKVERGELSKLDLDISKILMQAEEGGPSLRDAEFLRSFASKGILLIQFRRGTIAKISDSLELLQAQILSRTRRKPVFFEEGDPLRAVAERMVYPAKVRSVRTSWLPGGTSQTVLDVTGKMDVDLDEASKLLSDLFEADVNITRRAGT